MTRLSYVFRAVLLGLLTAQIIATVQVFLSDLHLYDAVSAMGEMGYLTVPNAVVLPSLKKLGPAMRGGVFFTLSLGAGLSLFAVASAWAWVRLFGRHRIVSAILALLWLICLVAVNHNGLDLMVTGYFVAVPLVVFGAASRWMPQEAASTPWFHRLFPVMPIVLLTLLWSLQADRFLFLDIRDFLLLSNPVGKRVDAFYYGNTLYPASVFKTLEQKTLKTCRLTGVEDPKKMARVHAALIAFDYLPMARQSPVDLEVHGAQGELSLRRDGTEVFRISSGAFLSDPAKALTRFSEEIDRHSRFRQATILCLLVGFPVFLYILCFSLIEFAVGFMVRPPLATAMAGILCLAVGLGLLAPLRVGRPAKVEVPDVAEALQSTSWKERVSAMRTVVDEKLDVCRLPNYERLLASSYLPERYWMAKALGNSKAPEAYGQLLRLLDDSHPNVVSMAFRSLGQRRERRAVPEILKRIKTSNHWYNQWYAYRALKALGWRQEAIPGPSS